jgi:hypothetical protein
MNDFDRKQAFRGRWLGGFVGAALLFSAPAPAARFNQTCLDLLKKDRAAILQKFGKLQDSPRTYTPERARTIQAKVETYLTSIGDVLKNFNIDVFFRDELSQLPEVIALSETERGALESVLAKSFTARRLPAYRALENDLAAVHLGNLPIAKIRESMDRSFRIWRTKVIFDETGPSVYNQLAKTYVKRLGMSEYSMDIGALGKNGWEAFFDADTGHGVFNPSMPGLMADIFTSTEAHESIHMIVQSLAAEGHDSPYAVWMGINPKYKNTGAIGIRQRVALAKATDPLGDGDYYRNQMFLDEFPAHVIQSAYLNVDLSKAIRKRFQIAVDAVRKPTIKDELEDAYAEYLRSSGDVSWENYSDEAKRAFETFLGAKANDGRTSVAKILTEMTKYINWIDLVEDSGSAGVAEARKIVESAVAAGKPGNLISIKPDKILGRAGYMIEVKIPIDVLQTDGTYLRQARGATIAFRFTNQGPLTESVTIDQLRKVLARADWVDEIATRAKREIQAYAEFLDENGELVEYSFADAFRLKFIHTRLRQLTRETLERIRSTGK